MGYVRSAEMVKYGVDYTPWTEIRCSDGSTLRVSGCGTRVQLSYLHRSPEKRGQLFVSDVHNVAQLSLLRRKLGLDPSLWPGEERRTRK